MYQKTTRKYVKRKVRASERTRVNRALVGARLVAKVNNAEVTVSLRNKRNPNGIGIQVSPDGTTKVGRFIMLEWAKRNGYEDVQPRPRRRRWLDIPSTSGRK